MEKINATVLIVDDDSDVLISAKLFLKNKIARILQSSHPTELNKLLSSEKIDLILLDMNYRVGFNDGKEGLYWLNHIKEIDSSIVVILMTAYGEIELAVEAIKAGAFDFILKPWGNDKFYATIKAGLASKKQSGEKEIVSSQIKNKKKEQKEFNLIKGKSAQIVELFDKINKVAITDANVLILGENGSGKQLIAKEIHRVSERREGPFVHVDIGTLSENLFESELFGYKKGAFTDAKEDKQGRIEMAENGSIFLDEIGNLSLRLQSKILTLIQDRKFTPLGDTKERSFNARLIFATNAPLHKWVEEGKFRQDLMYRINTVEMHIPSLRERKVDIPEFIDFYLNHFKEKYLKENLRISPEAMDLLINHQWPGNIRELQHTIERGVIMSDGHVLNKGDFNLLSGSVSTNKLNDRIDDLNLEKVEKLLIEKAMAKHHGNISKAAKELGLTRAALYRRMEKHDI
jgi:DNA-binding NtrC family response regulator